MASPKYAIAENERLLLHPERLPPLALHDVWRVEDRYLDGGRLQLRTMTNLHGGERVFKLCKKYVSPDPVTAPIVNVNLSADGHAALAALPGWLAREQRFRSANDPRFGIDLFTGAHAGLVLAKIEQTDREAVIGEAVPAWVVREVTDDPFFTNGNLARAEPADLAPSSRGVRERRHDRRDPTPVRNRVLSGRATVADAKGAA